MRFLRFVAQVSTFHGAMGFVAAPKNTHRLGLPSSVSSLQLVGRLFASSSNSDKYVQKTSKNPDGGYDIQAASVPLVWEQLQTASRRPVLDLSSRDASPEENEVDTEDDTEQWALGQRWKATKSGLQTLGISMDDKEMDFLQQCPQLLRLETDMVLETAEWIIGEFGVDVGGVDYFATQKSAPKILSYRLSDVQYGLEFMSTMMMQPAKPACQASADFFLTAIDGGIQEQSIKNALGAAGAATSQANQKVAGDAMSSLQELKKYKTRGF